MKRKQLWDAKKLANPFASDSYLSAGLVTRVLPQPTVSPTQQPCHLYSSALFSSLLVSSPFLYLLSVPPQ
jgi:hypothetical protein